MLVEARGSSSFEKIGQEIYTNSSEIGRVFEPSYYSVAGKGYSYSCIRITYRKIL